MKNFALLALLVLGSSFSALAQDKLHFKNGEIREVHVESIESQIVVYSPIPSTGNTVQIEKKLLAKVVMEDGRVFEFDDYDEYSEINFEGVPTNHALRMGFLTPAWGNFRLEYDYLVKSGQILHTSFTAIGVTGSNDDEMALYGFNRNGAGLSVGYKLQTSPDYYVSNMRRTHRMRGGYFMPEVSLSLMTFDEEWGYYDPNSNQYITGVSDAVATGASFTVSYGRQNVVGKRFLIDYSIGLGYSFINISHSDIPIEAEDHVLNSSDYYGLSMGNFIHVGDGIPLSFKTRLSIGLLL